MIALQREQEAPEPKIELSLEARVFLAFKYRTPDRFKLLDQLMRANVDPDKQLTDKTVYLSEKAKKILREVLKKYFRGETILLNHKYLKKITLCKADQNNIILEELASILKVQYWRLYKNHGVKKSRILHFQINPAVLDELRNAGHLNSEFYPDFFRGTNTNRNIFNEDKDIDLASNFFENSESKNQEETSTAKIINFPTRIKKRLPNQRRKSTNSETKAKVVRLNQYPRQYNTPKTLAEHYPLNQEDCTELQSESGREFSLNAMNEILLGMSRKPKESQLKFPSKAAFMSYMTKCLMYEMRDAVKTDNESFRIKVVITEEDRSYVKRERPLPAEEECKADDLENRTTDGFQRLSMLGMLEKLIN
jgi:hypothetical protein